jgi:phage/plasmid-associated DNA primase
MLRWETGDLLPHNPDFHSTVQLPVEYVPTATCPRFETFIAEVLPADLWTPTADSPGFIWELIGYTLY